MNQRTDQHTAMDDVKTVFDALLELESTAQSTQRGAPRQQLRSKVAILPANPVDRPGHRMEGVCQNASNTGCRIVSTLPPIVGNVYWLEFDPATQLGKQYARCCRCRLLREDMYDAGFVFFVPVQVTEGSRHDLSEMV